QAVITGFSSGSLPVSPNAFCGNPTSAYAAFVAKFTADGSGLVYATMLCGGNTQGASVAVDPVGAAYVTGTTDSPAAFQPILLQRIQGYAPSGSANVALKLDTSSALQWSTFLCQYGFVTIFSQRQFAVDATRTGYVLACSSL